MLCRVEKNAKRGRQEGDGKEGSKTGGAVGLWGARVGGENALTASFVPCIWWAQLQAQSPWALCSGPGAHPTYPQGGGPGLTTCHPFCPQGLGCAVDQRGPRWDIASPIPSLVPTKCRVTTLTSAHSGGWGASAVGRGPEESSEYQRHLFWLSTDYPNPNSGSFHR